MRALADGKASRLDTEVERGDRDRVPHRGCCGFESASMSAVLGAGSSPRVGLGIEPNCISNTDRGSMGRLGVLEEDVPAVLVLI
jgi:hypothetical protein